MSWIVSKLSNLVPLVTVSWGRRDKRKRKEESSGCGGDEDYGDGDLAMVGVGGRRQCQPPKKMPKVDKEIVCACKLKSELDKMEIQFEELKKRLALAEEAEQKDKDEKLQKDEGVGGGNKKAEITRGQRVSLLECWNNVKEDLMKHKKALEMFVNQSKDKDDQQTCFGVLENLYRCIELMANAMNELDDKISRIPQDFQYLSEPGSVIGTENADKMNNGGGKSNSNAAGSAVESSEILGSGSPSTSSIITTATAADLMNKGNDKVRLAVSCETENKIPESKTSSGTENKIPESKKSSETESTAIIAITPIETLTSTTGSFPEMEIPLSHPGPLLPGTRSATAAFQRARAELQKLTVETDICSTDNFSTMIGLENQIQFLKENVVTPLTNKEVFLERSLSIPKGIIFYGSSYGMLSLAKALATELSGALDTKVRLYTRRKELTFPRFLNMAGMADVFLRKLFATAVANKPSIIFLEDMPSCYNYDPTNGSCDFAVSTLTDEMTKLKQTGEVLVIGTTDELRKIPRYHWNNGCFNLHLEFPKELDTKLRKHILCLETANWTHKPEDVVLDYMASRTDVLNAEEVARVVAEAYRIGLQGLIRLEEEKRCRSCKPGLKLDKVIMDAVNPTLEDWINALTNTLKASSLENLELEMKGKVASTAYPQIKNSKNVVNQPQILDLSLSFGSVGGLKEQIRILKENIVFPVEHKKHLKEWGMQPVRGMIFHGPPGTGKTLLAKVLAAELSRLGDKKNFSFFYQKATDCFNMYVGESERILRELFRNAEKCKPSIIFFDEMDGLCPTRNDSNTRFYNSLVTTLLGLMDNVKRGKVFVIAATNRLESLDPAMRRPGRFDKIIAFQPPTKDERKTILSIHTNTWKNGRNDDVLAEVANQTEGYTGADLEQLCRQAFVFALRRHFKTANEIEGNKHTNVGTKTIDHQPKNTGQTMPLTSSSAPMCRSPSSTITETDVAIGVGPTFDTLEVLVEDWWKAMSTVRASNSTVFGSGLLQAKPVPPGLSQLLKSNIHGVVDKLVNFLPQPQPLTADSSDTDADIDVDTIDIELTKREKGAGLKSFLIWEDGKNKTKFLDNYFIPILLSHPDLKQTIPYSLDIGVACSRSRAGILSIFQQCIAASGEGERTALLFLPSIDTLQSSLQELVGTSGLHLFSLILEQVHSLRGENAIILASSGTPPSQLPPELQSLFKGTKNTRSSQLGKPTASEFGNFFLPILNPFPSLMSRVEKLGSSPPGVRRDYFLLMDLKGELELVARIASERIRDGKQMDLEKKLSKVLDSFERYELQGEGSIFIGDMYI